MLQELPKNPRIFLLFHFTGYSRGGMRTKKEAQHPSQGTERLRRYHPN